jgi:hypothetical protein
MFGLLARRGPHTVEEAVGLLSEAYPNFAQYHSDLALEWIEKEKATIAKRRRKRGRPKDADRVIAGCSASALKTVTRAFPSSKSFLEVQRAIKQLGGPRKVLELFKVFGR